MGIEPTENHTSTVCLDGSKVKRQREIHGLTQLYISKVVGVTTDTISRWENNRYPTIRRENALNLAEALEVPLDQILRKLPEEELAPEPRRNRVLPLTVAGSVLLLIVMIAVWSFLSRQVPVAVNVVAERILPDFAAPATAIPVQVKLTRNGDAQGFILRENFPQGWQLLEAYPPPSSLDNVHGVARWIVKAGDQVERIVYLVQVDVSASQDSPAAFRGEIIAGTGDNQMSTLILGETGLKVASVHWADSNGDGRIDDLEMLDTSYTVDEMTGVHLDWDYLESLWDADGYRWNDQQKRFVPQHVEEKSP
jgi:transcriptional regulator with XRE-family HTH domain